MTRATAEDWLRFLRPIAASVRNVPTEPDAKGRAAALAFALDVPAAWLTPARQRELCRKCEFWPSIAEIEAVFAEQRRDAARSRAIATAGGAAMLPAPQRVELTDAERADMRAKAAALIAELSAGTARADRPRPEPRTVSPHALLAGYEAAALAGNAAAAMRAAQLRRQLHLEEG